MFKIDISIPLKNTKERGWKSPRRIMQSSREKEKEANYSVNYTSDWEHLWAHHGCVGAVVVIEKLKTIITAAPFSS